MLLFRLQYPKIDIYDFKKRLIVYIVTVLTSPKAGNSIYKTSFCKIVYMCPLLPSCTDTWKCPVNSSLLLLFLHVFTYISLEKAALGIYTF